MSAPGRTLCVLLPASWAYRWGLSQIEGGWAVFDAGTRWERRCPARVMTLAQVPDATVALVRTERGGWRWAEIRRGDVLPQRFELLELDDNGYDDEQRALLPPETFARFEHLELD